MTALSTHKEILRLILDCTQVFACTEAIFDIVLSPPCEHYINGTAQAKKKPLMTSEFNNDQPSEITDAGLLFRSSALNQ